MIAVLMLAILGGHALRLSDGAPARRSSSDCAFFAESPVLPFTVNGIGLETSPRPSA
jgi:hypothetical protein